MKRRLFLLAAMCFAALAGAQPVYESRDRAGPVFSDLPSQGASEVKLPPANLMDSPQVAPIVIPRPEHGAAAPYTALQIIQPENGGTVHSNTGQISLAVVIEPALQTERGDALAVRLDNTLLPTTRGTLRFDINPSEWQQAAVDSVEHQLEVIVVDGSGTALIRSAPVRFFVHRATRH
ncbi:DUF4124 domain-containing protein [Accumulibacter sp.]|uniref:DUF4124 domain-containing protein n=1 Tax=Accumulibacter sp. TaxID=2053492 RepID=UPI001A52E281|nr:DUF4124 domain-containing protein [Accumulibacter sp.]MBL8373214.1 hypothetical protein [Accumulibacter sp.]